MREWVAQEDDFVLKQAKKKAEIRVKEGRPKPIDWLTITLRVVDTARNPLDDDIDDADLEYVDPSSVFDDLSESQLGDLRKDIETYMNLEQNSKNRDYWKTMNIICKDMLKKSRAQEPEGRVVGSVSNDIDRLLGPKSYEQLEVLEKQIRSKLASDEPIDTDYWQQLLDSLLVWKAKAKLKKVYKAVLDARLDNLKRENEKEAQRTADAFSHPSQYDRASMNYDKKLDPDPLLQIQAKDKSFDIVDEAAFLQRIALERTKVDRMVYVPLAKSAMYQQPSLNKDADRGTKDITRPRTTGDHVEEASSAATALFDREVAKGVGEDEEVFAVEEEVETKNKELWMGKYRPRKPKYFNRVQMGYEWNKYNQTHYDYDNPPPKVIQGYKFHIFYPDLIDKTKAPTYKIIREGGRKKGQTLAPAGEEDTCIIRFMSGPPYEDIAFRIVDRDWDYSAKHDRGFKSTFERGVLTLHFSFKKIYYRK